MAGVSREPHDFSRSLYRAMRSHGYDMVPVNPGIEEVEGDRCYAAVADIDPPPEGVILMTPPALTEILVRECHAAGIPRVWMYRSLGHGSVSDEALEYCRDHDITVIPGECPFMYLAGAGLVHDAHRFCRKLVGAFPDE